MNYRAAAQIPQRNGHRLPNELDASLLRIPLVGVLPATDPRVVGTIKATRSNLMKDGLVKRFVGHEGAFIPCSFWLAEALVMAGKLG
jgi:GH15 family glucan-1,4-alpha-glucosidase